MAGITPTTDSIDGLITRSDKLAWGWNQYEIIGWSDTEAIQDGDTSISTGNITATLISSDGLITRSDKFAWGWNLNELIGWNNTEAIQDGDAIN